MAKGVACFFALTVCANVDPSLSLSVLDADRASLGPNETAETIVLPTTDGQEQEEEASFIDDDQKSASYNDVGQDNSGLPSGNQCCLEARSGADRVCFRHGTEVRHDCKRRLGGPSTAIVDVDRRGFTCDARFVDMYTYNMDLLSECDGVEAVQDWGACAASGARAATDGAVRLDATQASAQNPDRMCYLESVLGTEGGVMLAAGKEAGGESLLDLNCKTKDDWGSLSGWMCTWFGPNPATLRLRFEVLGGRSCEILRIKKGGQYRGQQLLNAAIATCEAAGYRVQRLTDAFEFPLSLGYTVSGQALGLVHRGWTWYMRNGFLPVYHHLMQGLPDVKSAVSAASHSGVVNLRESLGPHLTTWCSGVRATRKQFGDLTGQEGLPESIKKVLEPGEFKTFTESHDAVRNASAPATMYRMSDLPGASGEDMKTRVEAMLKSAGCPRVS